MAKPATDLPSEAEKGALIAHLATRGITGLTLADFASQDRRGIARTVKKQILSLKGVSSDNPALNN